ncbi:MAG: hypothetical protein P4L83_19640 [Nevskia sp.]|nr:hypothetical protein [Nevskia sp.]
MNDSSPHIDRIVAFLMSIGIEARPAALPEGTFLPGVKVAGGALVFDRARVWPGDLLHEAGHIAVTPAAERDALEGDVDTEGEAASNGEVEAIAWSFAAARHIGLPLELLFHPEGYRGRAQALLLSYRIGVYPGAYGLSRIGLTRTETDAAQQGGAPYPHMTRWLRE